MVKHSLIKNIIDGTRRSGIGRWLLIIFVFNAIYGIFEMISSKIMIMIYSYVRDDMMNKAMISFLSVTILDIVLLKCIKSIGYLKKITLINPFKKERSKYYLELMGKANIEWIESKKYGQEIIDAMDDGILALESILDNLNRITIPVFIGIGTIVIISLDMGMIGFISTSICMIIIVIVGCHYMHQLYVSQKKYHGDIKEPRKNIRRSSSRFFVSILNGSIGTLQKMIGDEREKIFELSSNIAAKRNHNHFMMDMIIHILCASNTIILTYYSGDSLKIASIMTIMWKVNETIRWMLWALSDIVDNVSKWGLFEDILYEYKVEQNKYLNDKIVLKISDIEPLITDDNIYEIGITGPSGCGKTTYMKSKLSELIRTYEKSCWLYLDQEICHMFPNSKISIREFLYEGISERSDSTICELSKKLGIQDIINKNVLGSSKSFKGPSGGEKKRIMILKYILPIYIGKSGISYIFNDEVTAGLDYESWKRVRKVFEELKCEYGVKFFTIDHHDEFKPLVKIIPIKIIREKREKKKIDKRSWIQMLKGRDNGDLIYIEPPKVNVKIE